MLVSERLESAMQAAGYSQSDLARVVGTSQQTIWKLVNGESRTTRYLLQIARVLNVSPEYLNGESDEKGGSGSGLVLDAEQHQLLRQFDALDRDARDLVRRLVDRLSESCGGGPTLHSPRLSYIAKGER